MSIPSRRRWHLRILDTGAEHTGATFTEVHQAAAGRPYVASTKETR